MADVAIETFGPYQILARLGEGGMATVDRASVELVPGTKQVVALKRLLPHLASDADFVKAFVREAHLASHLRHPNVVETYDLGRIDDIYFIAMELVEGPDLRIILRQTALATGPMPVPVALNLMMQLCASLDYAHNLRNNEGEALGIIHRDVSPSNIIVTRDGILKLIDFGIAKASASGLHTSSGHLKGKFAYMAPEYLMGQLDQRSDLFSLGVIAHELLTARPLFAAGDDAETLNRLRTMDVLPPSRFNPAVPTEVDDIVMTALSRDPAARWQNASAIHAVLGTVTKRLGLTCKNVDIDGWAQWAFRQPLRGKGSPAPVLSDTGNPSIFIEAAAEIAAAIADDSATDDDAPQLAGGTPTRAVSLLKDDEYEKARLAYATGEEKRTLMMEMTSSQRQSLAGLGANLGRAQPVAPRHGSASGGTDDRSSTVMIDDDRARTKMLEPSVQVRQSAVVMATRATPQPMAAVDAQGGGARTSTTFSASGAPMRATGISPAEPMRMTPQPMPVVQPQGGYPPPGATPMPMPAATPHGPPTPMPMPVATPQAGIPHTGSMPAIGQPPQAMRPQSQPLAVPLPMHDEDPLAGLPRRRQRKQQSNVWLFAIVIAAAAGAGLVYVLLTRLG